MNYNEQAQMQGWESYLNSQNPQEQEYDAPLCECGLPLCERYYDLYGRELCEECTKKEARKEPLQLINDLMDEILEILLVRRG